MGQATTASSSASWNAVSRSSNRDVEPTRVDLTVSYRTPEEVLDFAAPTLRAAAPDLNAAARFVGPGIRPAWIR